MNKILLDLSTWKSLRYVCDILQKEPNHKCVTTRGSYDNNFHYEPNDNCCQGNERYYNKFLIPPSAESLTNLEEFKIINTTHELSNFFLKWCECK